MPRTAKTKGTKENCWCQARRRIGASSDRAHTMNPCRYADITTCPGALVDLRTTFDLPTDQKFDSFIARRSAHSAIRQPPTG
jgi:hypothetical protein